MEASPLYPSDVAFTPAVKAIQARKGSRAPMRGWRRADPGGPRSTGTWPRSSLPRPASSSPRPARTGSRISSIAAGRRGFSNALDDHTIAFADFRSATGSI